MASTMAGQKTVPVYDPRQQGNTLDANNTLLNKAASQSTSLYQQCSSLRARLMRIHQFPAFFSLSSSLASSTDAVTQLWDLFALGVPLCYIFNLLPPPITPININTSPDFDVNDDRLKKRAIALFAMGVQQVPQTEAFTVRYLWDRESDGLVKVINTVTTIVDRVPQEMFEFLPPPPSVSYEHTDSPVAENVQERTQNNIIRELIETERKYVQDLDVLQKYTLALFQTNAMSQDLIHYLFPNLDKLLNFQHKFLMRLESTAELPWKDQRWGLHFIENVRFIAFYHNHLLIMVIPLCSTKLSLSLLDPSGAKEEEFEVYEPYCANYNQGNSSDIIVSNEPNLSLLNHMINAKSELPSFLTRPVGRICKYPLLLDALIKVTSTSDYAHIEDLKKGSAAAKRITDKANEAHRRAENDQTVKALEIRIKDWKGHHLSHFGNLVLDDIFVVKKSGVDREYHVFLFENIILCCKEDIQPRANGCKTVNKNGSILKKQAPLSLPSGADRSKRKNIPLLLKGRIFLKNVTQVVPRNSTCSSRPSSYALEVWWRGDDDLDCFILRCRYEEHIKRWEAQINRLIKKAGKRRAG